MRFSIIIPIYKVEKYLRPCVDSVLQQTFRDFELILVDDGSPDSCPQICDEYAAKDARIKVIHQKNAGLACARNAGIAEAKGEYLVCIDSDDYLLNKDMLAELNEKSKSEPDVILYGYKKLFESDGSWGADVCPTLENGLSAGASLKSLLLSGSYTATAWTKAVKLSLLHENKIQFRPGMISEDIDWYMDVLCHARKFECLEKACIAYRQRPGSISHSPKINSLTDNIWILEEWPKRFDSRNLDEDLKASLMNAMAYYWANLLVLYSSYPSNAVSQYKSQVKALIYLHKYAITSRALTMKNFYSLLGFDMTVLLLKVLGKIKKRQ